MNESREALALLGACLPLFSALIWMSMTALSVHDSHTRLERRIKHAVLWLYIFVAITWISLLLYTYAPPLVVYLNVPAYLAYLLMPVQLYRYICELSETDQLRPFSLWHYFLPVLIVSVLGLWSLFVPWDVQVGLVESRGQVSPDHPAYSRLFLSKPAMRSVYIAVYTILSLVRLVRYYRKIGHKTDQHPRPKRWIVGLMGFVVMMLLVTATSVMVPRGEIITSWLVLTIAGLRTGEDFIVGYNVIRRNFLLYIPSVRERMDRMETASQKGGAEEPLSHETGIVHIPKKGLRLTKKRFEDHVISNKFWLDPDVKLTDLVEPLGTSRTTLSNFINKTYGMNFKRYINSLRLSELNRLLALPSNAGKTADDLFCKAGFASKRNYTRAKQAAE